MSKIVVYDFDKTLTKRDTLFGFFVFNEKYNISFFLKTFLYFCLMVLSKFKIISNFKLKDMGIKLFLKNLKKEDLNYKIKNYKEKIEYNFLYEKVDFSENNIYIISASFEDYLREIFPKNINVIGSKLKIDSLGIKGLEFNCYGKNKVEILKEMGIDKIDIFYTDSMSDLPLVNISEETILIKDNNEIICNSSEEFIKEIKK